MATLKPQSNGQLYSNTLMVHWPLMGVLLHFGTAREWAGCDHAQSPPRCTKCNINGQSTKFISLVVAL